MKDEKRPEGEYTPNESNDKLPAGEIKLRSPFLKRLDNFFYHYKWHTLVGVFLLAVVLIVCFQTCSREPYDIEIIYAGPQNLNDEQMQIDIRNAVSPHVNDTDEDGQKAVRLIHYWINEDLYDGKIEGSDVAADVGYLAQNSFANEDAFVSEMQVGNASICLLSPYLFQMLDEQAAFMRITDIYPELSANENRLCVKYEDGSINRFGVLLSETAFGQMAGLSSLPKDTILCIRKPKFTPGNSHAEEDHAHSVEVFCRLLALGVKQEEEE